MVTGFWNRLSYHRQLFTALIIYSFVLIGGVAFFQYNREKEFKTDELNGRLQQINARILYDLESSGKLPEPEKMGWTTFDDLRISIIDNSGNVVFDNSLDSIPASNHFRREEIVKAMKSGEGYAVRRHSELTDASYFYSARKGKDFIVRCAVPYSTSLTDILAADFTIIWIMLGITAAMCIAGYFATHRLGQHIARLNQFAERAERGEPILDTEPFPHDELGEISNHIVRLYARLQQAITQRDKEHRAALRQEQEKIRIKRQLTNNINHELKTPVAAMQACLETLSIHPDLPDAKKNEFVERCLAANRRLVKLMEDVSSITRMEDGSTAIPRSEIDISIIVDDVCRELEPSATLKGIAIVNKVTSGIRTDGNPTLISSIFRNLIDNAIAYSEGDTIEIEAFENDKGCHTFTLADNGTGVPDEHLPHLFERFYRVDKGRSRQAGGTGLGLSIVRNAVIWHGGTIRVENRPTGGLIFTFTV